MLAANAYRYGANSPLDNVDPAGEHPIDQSNFNVPLQAPRLPATPDGGPSTPTYTLTASVSRPGPELPYACTAFLQYEVPCIPAPTRFSAAAAESSVAIDYFPSDEHLYTPMGFGTCSGGRFIDVYARPDVFLGRLGQAIEVKTGSQSYGGNIVAQVSKDGVLDAYGMTFNTPPKPLAAGVSWQFLPNLAGTTNPSVPLIGALLSNNLGATIYYYDPLAEPEPKPAPVLQPQPLPLLLPQPSPLTNPVPSPPAATGGRGRRPDLCRRRCRVDRGGRGRVRSVLRGVRPRGWRRCPCRVVVMAG